MMRTKKEMMKVLDESDCPESVIHLCLHLHNTGTGIAKIDAIHTCGCKCACAEEFLEAVKKVIPEATYKKILDYIACKEKGQEPVNLDHTPKEECDPKPEETPSTPPPGDSPKESPVKEMNATESIDYIRAMDKEKDTETLKLIVECDERVTVQRAAKEKLGVQ